MFFPHFFLHALSKLWLNFTFSILRCKELKSLGTRATGFSWKAAPSFVAYLNTEPSLHFPYFEPFPTFGEIVSLPFKYSSVIREVHALLEEFLEISMNIY